MRMRMRVCTGDPRPRTMPVVMRRQLLREVGSLNDAVDGTFLHQTFSFRPRSGRRGRSRCELAKREERTLTSTPML